MLHRKTLMTCKFNETLHGIMKDIEIVNFVKSCALKFMLVMFITWSFSLRAIILFQNQVAILWQNFIGCYRIVEKAQNFFFG